MQMSISSVQVRISGD